MDKMQDTRIIVKYRKTRIFLAFIGSILYVLLGIWILNKHPHEIEKLDGYNSPGIAYGVAIVSIIFFGTAAACILKQLFSTNPALIITNDGIIKYVGCHSPCVIPWNIIDNVSETQVRGTRIISIGIMIQYYYYIPDDAFSSYIDLENTPVCSQSSLDFTSAYVDMDHEELMKLLRNLANEYGNHKGRHSK